MDETPIIFDLSGNITIDEIGMQSVSIHIIRHKKTNFIVVLTYMANRIKLSPLVIFKFKKVLWGNFSQKVIVRTNPTGWINENEMLYWIENIWTKYARLSNP